MSESIEPIGKQDQIRVSELGEWVYCSVAWKLRGEGVSPDYQGMIELQAGLDLHHEHGAQVGRSSCKKSETVAAGRDSDHRRSPGALPLDGTVRVWAGCCC